MLRDFRVAMFNRLALGPYEFSRAAEQGNAEWLIVELSGRDSSVLQVTEAISASQIADGPAPDDLIPVQSRVAVRRAGAGGEDVFDFVRELPAGTRTDAVFSPGRGEARLVERRGKICLVAAGQHLRMQAGAGMMLVDVPEAPMVETIEHWKFDAAERSWIGEVRHCMA